jgi:RNA polymerase sigma factor (TIGR02999 family)
MDSGSGEITRLLTRLKQGDREAQQQLIPLVYGELRRLAAHYMRMERSDHTLQATALVHEAFLRITTAGEIDWQSRAHFFAVAAQTMRRVLVDYARASNSSKRAGTHQRISLDSAVVYNEDQSDGMVALDEALLRLEQLDPRQCRVVELRFFAGMSLDETAEVLGISTRTVKRDWNMARAWLHAELSEGLAR